MNLIVSKLFVACLLTICIYSNVLSQMVTVSFAGTRVSVAERPVCDTVDKCGGVLLNDTARNPSTALNNAAAKTFFFPIGEGHSAITSAFGMRLHPVFGNYRLHNGIDIKANYEAVHAFTGGVVAETGYNNRAGNYCKINHKNTIETIYAHLSRLFVKPGDWVNGGNIIGISGASGLVTGPHLHFAVKFNGVSISPLLLLREIK